MMPSRPGTPQPTTDRRHTGPVHVDVVATVWKTPQLGRREAAETCRVPTGMRRSMGARMHRGAVEEGSESAGAACLRRPYRSRTGRSGRRDSVGDGGNAPLTRLRRPAGRVLEAGDPDLERAFEGKCGAVGPFALQRRAERGGDDLLRGPAQPGPERRERDTGRGTGGVGRSQSRAAAGRSPPRASARAAASRAGTASGTINASRQISSARAAARLSAAASPATANAGAACTSAVASVKPAPSASSCSRPVSMCGSAGPGSPASASANP